MVGRLRRHRMVQPSGVVRGLLPAHRRRPYGSHHGFRLRSGEHQGSADGLKTFFALRHQPDPRLPSVGSAASSEPCYYVVDKGFEGEERHRRWLDRYGARIICAPKRNSSRKKPWPKRLRRWVAGLRQIVETVYEKLHNAFGLARERPHELSGLRARLAAKVALHNFCIWLNEHLGRPRLAFADLLGW
jgi:hypothetical protein